MLHNDRFFIGHSGLLCNAAVRIQSAPVPENKHFAVARLLLIRSPSAGIDFVFRTRLENAPNNDIHSDYDCHDVYVVRFEQPS